MSHEIFKILDEYKLLSPKKRQKAISVLSVEDTDFLIEKLNKAVERRIEKADQGLDLNLPYPSLQFMERIPNCLLLFDKVYIPDPLIDCLQPLSLSYASLESIVEKIYRNSLNSAAFEHFMGGVNEGVRNLKKNNINMADSVRLLQVDKIDKMISYYIEYEDLIDDGVLVPFTDSGVEYGKDEIEIVSIVTERIGKRYAEESLGKYKEEFAPLLSSKKDDIAFSGRSNYFNDSFRFILDNKWGDIVNLQTFLTTSIALKQYFPSSSSGNLMLGEDENKKYLDEIIKAIGEAANIMEPIVNWPKIGDEIFFSTLGNIPSRELLEIRYKERDAIEKFKYSAQEKLIDIRNAVGTKEYSDLVAKFSIEQKKQAAEISILANHIQKDHIRKSSVQLTTTLLSAAGAILSAITSTQAPLALVGTGIASAGFTAGISKLIETWISYKGEMDKLREKDSYILWKLHKHK